MSKSRDLPGVRLEELLCSVDYHLELPPEFVLVVRLPVDYRKEPLSLCCASFSEAHGVEEAPCRRETRSWRWPAFTFAYMTGLAWLAAVAVYQVGSLLGYGLPS